MIRFRRLVLEGFGKYKIKRTFTFTDGLNTFAAPNEAGKSTMLNGLAATLYGMDKAESVRQKSRDGSTRYAGELVFEDEDDTFRVEMDFSAEKVSLSRLDKTTGHYESLINKMQYSPASRAGADYRDFLSKRFGTSDKEVFLATFVVDEPAGMERAGPRSEPKVRIGKESLDKSWSLLESGEMGKGGAALSILEDRLGKDKVKGITKNIEDYWPEGNNQTADREMDKLKNDLSIKLDEHARAKEELDELAPLNQKAEDAAVRLKEAEERAGSARKNSAMLKKWVELRSEYQAASKAADNILLVAEKVRSNTGQRDGIRARLSECEAVPVRKHLSDDRLGLFISAVKEAEKAVDDASRVQKSCLEQLLTVKTEAGQIASVDILQKDASSKLEEMAQEAAKEIAAIQRSVDSYKAWFSQYGSVLDMRSDEREKLEALLSHKVEKPGTSDLRFWALIPFLLGIVGALLLWNRGLGLYWAASSALFGLAIGSAALVVAMRARKGAGRQGLPDEEAVLRAEEIRDRIARYDMMKRSAKPEEPTASLKQRADELSNLIEHIRAIGRLSDRAVLAVSRLSDEDLLTVLELAGEQPCKEAGKVLERGDAFWEKVAAENKGAAGHEAEILRLQMEQANIDRTIAQLISNFAKDEEDLSAKLEEAEEEAKQRIRRWQVAFDDRLDLKPTTENEMLTLVQKRLEDAEAEEKQAEEEALDAKEENLEYLRLRAMASTSQKHNLPELQDSIKDLEDRINRLDFEARSIALARQEMGNAVDGYGQEAREEIKGKVTSMMETVTGVKGRLVSLGEELGISVSEDGYEVRLSQLSQGTKDQLHICLRLAAAELLDGGRKVPVFFDDSFGTTDSTRLGRIRDLLSELAGERQIIVLSHSDDIGGWGRSITVTQND